MLKVFNVLLHLVFPWYFLLDPLRYLPATVIDLIRRAQWSTFLSPAAFKYVWFARFWKACGPGIKEMATPRVQPLIAQAHGIVIDIGPGSGEWIALFDKSKVEKIYGIEPNKDHHALLRERIIQAGLSDIYVIVPVGVEELEQSASIHGQRSDDSWVRKGEVDCVVTVQCLCSIPQPKAMISDLYAYLKPGGEWIAYEHVALRGNPWLETYQSFINIFWPHLMGGCQMTRDTGALLIAAGHWSNVDLKAPDDEPSYHLLPHLMGVLTK